MRETKSSRRMKLRLLILLTTALCGLCTAAAQPAPEKTTPREGIFTFGPGTTISADRELAPLAEYAAEYLGCGVRNGMAGEGSVVLTLDAPDGEPSEAYTLDIAPDHIQIGSSTCGGVFNGLQQLFRLLPPEVYARRGIAPGTGIACVRIEDKPRFGFLVSIQSHGDYDMNDASLDIVHAATDYGDYDALMDEYLSCIKKTDAAVQELCDYFTAQYEKTGRKVIVAMAGDHAPSFVTHVADASFAETDNELQILERSTPFFIWANYPLEHTAAATSTTDPLNRMDMVMLTPTLLQQAGLPLSDYYEYLLEMKHNTPVVTAANDYMKVDGSTAEYGADPALDEWAKGYLMLEYNNIGAHAKRDQSIFDPAE